ncbi:MAG TPA: hypothetical protein VFG24_03540 [Nitrosopumilaceae archaeon]|nr:hypothetical protein [Nitrosopumilaceae archaeon]
MKIIDYTLLRKSCERNNGHIDLESIVNEYLKTGWHLYGEPFSGECYIYQAMIRVEDEKSEDESKEWEATINIAKKEQPHKEDPELLRDWGRKLEDIKEFATKTGLPNEVQRELLCLVEDYYQSSIKRAIDKYKAGVE